jgi:anti-sigma regulatory factor (Ser/Thr protein kinase)
VLAEFMAHHGACHRKVGAKAAMSQRDMDPAAHSASGASTLQLVPDGNAVATAMQWLEEMAEREQWPFKVRFALELSLDEALTNIVSYAFTEGTARGDVPEVAVSFRRDGANLVIEIVDNGRPYDPTLTALPAVAASLDDAQIGGQGVRLMRHYMKHIAYRCDAGRNRLTLVAAYED